MLNSASIIGNLGSDPELRTTPAGQSVAELRIATSRSWTDKVSGTRKEETEWHTIVVWGKQAESCAKYLAKGRQVFVKGRIQTETWEKDGAKHYRTKIVADEVLFLGPKASRDEEEPAADAA
jgi:single-strand DNA-binding protein